jgi:hypothetical protein
MLKQIKKALIAYFTEDANGRRVLRKPPLGVSVSDAALRFTVSMKLTYRAGSRYCCTMVPCHFHPDWEELRRQLRKEGVDVNHPLRIYLRCVYE